jgi:hypothetical protein
VCGGHQPRRCIFEPAIIDDLINRDLLNIPLKPLNNYILITSNNKVPQVEANCNYNFAAVLKNTVNRKPRHDLRLLTAAERPVRREDGHHFRVTEVLAPRLHGFGGATDFLAKLGQRFPERVRIEIRQARLGERFLEDLADRASIRPMAPVESDSVKFAVGTQTDKARGKQGIIIAEELLNSRN